MSDNDDSGDRWVVDGPRDRCHVRQRSCASCDVTHGELVYTRRTARSAATTNNATLVGPLTDWLQHDKIDLDGIRRRCRFSSRKPMRGDLNVLAAFEQTDCLTEATCSSNNSGSQRITKLVGSVARTTSRRAAEGCKGLVGTCTPKQLLQ